MASVDYVALSRQVAREVGLPEPVFVELIRSESSFNPFAIGTAGEIGLGQLMPTTAVELGVNPYDPLDNLRGAARYLKRFFDKYKNWRLALSSYKGGEGNRNKPGPLQAADKVLTALGQANPAPPAAPGVWDQALGVMRSLPFPTPFSKPGEFSKIAAPLTFGLVAVVLIVGGIWFMLGRPLPMLRAG